MMGQRSPYSVTRDILFEMQLSMDSMIVLRSAVSSGHVLSTGRPFSQVRSSQKFLHGEKNNNKT